jgi:hypothetical protein
LPSGLRREIIAAANETGVSLDLIESAPVKFRVASMAASFDELLMENRDIHDLLFQWIRWTPAEVARKRDGIPIDSAELDPVSRLGIKWTAPWRGAKIMAKLGCSRFLSRRATKVYQQSAALGLITVEKFEPKELVRAGKTLEKIWLLATKCGFSFQPIAGSVMLALHSRLNHGRRLPSRHLAMANRIRRMMGTSVPAFETNFPAILFRIGKASAPSARAPRLPLEAVFSQAKVGERSLV